MASIAEHLRNRAWGARALALRLESASLLALDRHAGTDTWQCPAADEFFLTVVDFQHRLLGAADDLRWEALRLEQQAEEQEATDAAAAAVGFVGAR